MSERTQDLIRALVTEFEFEVNPLGLTEGDAARQVESFKAKLADLVFEVAANGVPAAPLDPGILSRPLVDRTTPALERVKALAHRIASEYGLRVWFDRIDIAGKTGRYQLSYSDKDHIG